MAAGLPPHPHGVEPEGNLLLEPRAAASSARVLRCSGLGPLLARLDDALLLKICGFVEPDVLATLCTVTAVLRAFASFDELWRAPCLTRAAGAPLTFGGSWKATWFGAHLPHARLHQAASSSTWLQRGTPSLFSDALYQPHLLVHGPSAMRQLRGPPCERLAPAGAVDAFEVGGFEAGIGRPVVLEGAGDGSASSDTWDEASMLRRFGDRVYHAGGVNFRLRDYLHYARSNADDPPLYLFDPTFGHSTPELLEAYSVPACFSDDLFNLLDPPPQRTTGASPSRRAEDGSSSIACTDTAACFEAAACASGGEARGRPEAEPQSWQGLQPCDDMPLMAAERPDYRWLLIGGRRSGQTWHQDPNGTSAWNLTIRGRKRWLFFPPHVTPPGVLPTSTAGDASSRGDYLTPISIAEWGRDFYAEACAMPGCLETESGPGELQPLHVHLSLCAAYNLTLTTSRVHSLLVAGDVVYVPRGWWHMVLNLEPFTVAVSHHFLSPAGLYNTLRLLRNAPHQVSGIDRGLSRDSQQAKGGCQQARGARHQAADAPATTSTADVGADDHARRSAAGVALHDQLMAALQSQRPEALAKAENALRPRQPSARTAWQALVAPAVASEPFAFGF